MAGIRTCDRESQVQRPNHYTTEPPYCGHTTEPPTPWDTHGYNYPTRMAKNRKNPMSIFVAWLEDKDFTFIF